MTTTDCRDDIGDAKTPKMPPFLLMLEVNWLNTLEFARISVDVEEPDGVGGITVNVTLSGISIRRSNNNGIPLFCMRRSMFVKNTI